MPHQSASPSHAKRALFSGVAIAALCVGLTAHAQAQNSQLEPTFGTFSEAAGFGSFSLTIQAGGEIDANMVAGECNGFIAEAPDIVFDAQSPGSFFIETESSADTTMLVEAPDGQILCNDDFNELNAGMQIPAGTTGRYAIWVGTFDPISNNTFPDADIVISEASNQPAPDPTTPAAPGRDMASSGFSANLPPTFAEVSVASGFGSQTFDLQAGGFVDAFSTNQNCAGFVAEAPDYTVNFQAAGSDLSFAVTSQADTTLVVVGPDGSVSCNDDDVDLNPGLTIPSAAGGTYAVYVGTFEPIANEFYPDAQLTISTGPGTGTRPQTRPIQTPDGASAPDFLLERTALVPSFDSVGLPPGFGAFADDISAGGFEDASTFGPGCVGFVSDRPDYKVSYDGGEALLIAATAQEDTTIVVVTPTGELLCNDDTETLDPGVVIENAPSGTYSIWVGTFAAIENDEYPPATLLVEELLLGSSDDQRATPTPPPPSDVPSVQLTAGFEPDPFVAELFAGGPIEAASVDAACVGSIAQSPSFVLNYTAGDWPLRFLVTSDADTTLLVRAPDGQVLCNDDADGLNPAISLTSPSSGPYEVFIGTFDPSGGLPAAMLAITELLDEKVLPQDARVAATLGLGSQRQDFPLLAGGSFDAFESFGSTCAGFVAGNPDFLATISAAGVDVEMTVRSAEDTTLVVRGPDGQIACDDDSGGDLNPLVLIESAQLGTYEVWLGTYSSVGNAPATLSLRDANADSGTAPNVPGDGKK